MSFTLHVDADRWRAAQDRVKKAEPSLIPVIKGNGYGFTLPVLFAEATRLGSELVAIGTYAELATALKEFAGDVLVMEPFRSTIHGDLANANDPRVIHTVTSAEDLCALRSAVPEARVVVEGLTSMNRFGMPLAELPDIVRAAGALAVTLHLPLGSGHVAEIARFVEALRESGVDTFYVSHTTPGELAELRRRFPNVTFRPRIGTDLWLADKSAYQVRAHVLDVRPLPKGSRVGYRQRAASGGHVVVVSGGTSHGVAMESPAAAASARQRAIAVAEGVLEAAHRVRSPFVVSGRSPRFAEPPHMQCSLLHLAEGVAPPAIGDVVPVRMRLTTAYPDAVVLD